MDALVDFMKPLSSWFPAAVLRWYYFPSLVLVFSFASGGAVCVRP